MVARDANDRQSVLVRVASSISSHNVPAVVFEALLSLFNEAEADASLPGAAEMHPSVSRAPF